MSAQRARPPGLSQAVYLKCRASQPPGPSREAPDGLGSEHLWGRLRSALRQLLTSSMEATCAGTRGPSTWRRQTTGETARDGSRGPSFHSSRGRWGQTLHAPEGPPWLPASGGAGPPSQGGQSTATPRPTGRAGGWRGVQPFTARRRRCPAPQTAGLPRGHLATTAQRQRHGRQRPGGPRDTGTTLHEGGTRADPPRGPEKEPTPPAPGT